jgi:hypothetical protein
MPELTKIYHNDSSSYVFKYDMFSVFGFKVKYAECMLRNEHMQVRSLNYYECKQLEKHIKQFSRLFTSSFTDEKGKEFTITPP